MEKKEKKMCFAIQKNVFSLFYFLLLLWLWISKMICKA